MKTYRARAGSTNVQAFTVHETGWNQRTLNPRLDLKRYATGFSWGRYPLAMLQLSLALLCDALDDDERALALHVQYATDRIAKLNPHAGLMLSADSIRLDARLMEGRAKREAEHENA